MRLDLHLHTCYSPDSASSPEAVLATAKRKGLNGVAITDHDTLRGALETRDRNRDPAFQVIVGCEFTTDSGDIIGLFVKEAISSRRALDVIAQIHAQGGLALLPHPFHARPPREEVVQAVDLLEVFNARSSPDGNRRARELADRLQKPAVCGSDAHFVSDVGTCSVSLEDGDIRKALLGGPRTLETRYSPRYKAPASQVIKAWKQGNYRRIPFDTARMLKRLVEPASLRR
jgi:predicted metal-dependent phosphoesterase TrpH